MAEDKSDSSITDLESVCIRVWNKLHREVKRERSLLWRCTHNRLVLLEAVRKSPGQLTTVQLLPRLSLCQNLVSPWKDKTGSHCFLSSHMTPFDFSASSKHTKLLFSAVYPFIYSIWDDSDYLWHLEECTIPEISGLHSWKPWDETLVI